MSILTSTDAPPTDRAGRALSGGLSWGGLSRAGLAVAAGGAWLLFAFITLHWPDLGDWGRGEETALAAALFGAAIILAGGAGALYLSQSSFWSVSVDIAGRSSGVFSSMVNMGGQIGGAVTASLTPWIAQRFGWTTSFAIAAALAVVGAICWLTVHPERPLES